MLSIIIAIVVIVLFFVLNHYLNDMILSLLLVSFGLVFIGLNIIQYAWWMIAIGGFFIVFIFLMYFLINAAHG